MKAALPSVAIAASALIYLLQNTDSLMAATATTFALASYLYILFYQNIRPVRLSNGREKLLASSMLFIPFIIYSLATGSFQWLYSLGIAAFILAPIGALEMSKRYENFQLIFILAAIGCVWVPFDFGLLSAFWPWPKGEGAYVLNVLMAVNLCVLFFSDSLKIGYKVFPNADDIKTASFTLLALMAIIIPIGFATDFIAWNPQKLPYIGLTLLGIYLTIALPEELLFRGLLQNALTKTNWHWVKSLIIASVIFGLAHLNNGPPLPNVTFALLATIAGLFYGWLYHRTKNLAACSLLHALVDTIWVHFFLLPAAA